MRWFTSPRRALAALVIGFATPLLDALVVPHDVERINIPMVPMLLAIIVATLLGGVVTGVVTAAVSAGVLSYWFFRPRGNFKTLEGRPRASSCSSRWPPRCCSS